MVNSILPASLKKRIPAILALALTLAFAWLAMNRLELNDKSFLTSLEMRWVDAKFRTRGDRPGSNDVIIVGIDDKTLAKLGSVRVFQRDRWATLVSKLAEAGPKAIGFDVIFEDPDVSNPANDGKFAKAIKAAESVVMGVVLYLKPNPGPKRPDGKLDDELLNIVSEKQIFAVPHSAPGGEEQLQSVFLGSELHPNLIELTKAASSFGFVNFHPEDGRLRYQPQIIDYDGRLYPSLDFQLLRRYLNTPSLQVNLNAKGYVDNVRIGDHTVPTDQTGRLMLDYAGRRGTYQTVPMIDVMEGRVGREVFKDKIVLIGATVPGLNDLVATPFEPTLPGVELHANVIDNILHDRYLYRTWLHQSLDFALILIFGAFAGYFVPKLNATRAVFYTLLMLAAFTAFNYWTFISLHWVLSFIYPGLSLFVTSSSLISYNYFTEEREKKRTKSTFQFYLDQHVIEQVLSQPDMLKLGGEKRELTVLFSDIRGFTSFSEKMAPAEVVQFLNQYFERMQGIIFTHKGTLDKLIGDAVMCFWGAPLEMKDHALRGVLTALEMIHAVEDMRGVLVLPGGAKFEIGIGLNTGPMVYGNMGSPTRFSYTVMGDNVNLGSRLESLNKYYGTKILISDATFTAVSDLVLCRELDTIQVKGKSQAVTIYEPLGLRRLEDERREADRRGPMTPQKQIVKRLAMLRHGERRQEDRRLGSSGLMVKPEQEEIATMYGHALALYRKGDFDGAEMAFDHVLSLAPGDGPSRFMKSRIAKYRMEYTGDESPFDPVYKFDEK